MLKSLILYLSIIFVEVFLSKLLKYNNEKNDSSFGWKLKKLFIIFIMVLIPSILAGLRYGIGTDYFSYERIYNNYISMPNFNFYVYNGLSIEIGFFILVKISKIIFNSYSGFLFLSAFVTYFFAILSINRYGKYRYFGVMIFIYFILLYAPSFNIVRQMVSVSIIIYGFKYIENKSFFKYLLIVLLALSFHTSALFCLSFYFLNINSTNFSKTKKTIIIILAITIPFIFDYLFNVLSKMLIFSKYIMVYENIVGYSYRYSAIIIRIPIIIAILLFRKRLILHDKNNQLYLLIYLLEFTCVLLSFHMKWAVRFIYYCMISEIILVPQIISIVKGKNKLFTLFYFGLYYILYFIIVFGLWKNDGIIPYQITNLGGY